MKIIYAPDGQEPQTFDFDPEDLTGLEAEAIEDAGGTQWETYAEWASRFYRGGWRAMKVAVWLLLRRSNAELGFEELSNLKTAEVLIDMSDDEATEGKDGSGEADTAAADSDTGSESPTPDSALSTSN